MHKPGSASILIGALAVLGAVVTGCATHNERRCVGIAVVPSANNGHVLFRAFDDGSVEMAQGGYVTTQGKSNGEWKTEYRAGWEPVKSESSNH